MNFGIEFTELDTVISDLYRELPVSKFLKKFEKDINKGKFFDINVDFENKIFSFWYMDNMLGKVQYHLILDKNDKRNFNNSKEHAGIDKFIDLLKIGVKLEQIEREHELKAATAEKENQKLQKKLDAIDERKEQEYQKRISRYQLNVFLSEEEKKEYIKYLKAKNHPVLDEFDDVGDIMSDLSSNDNQLAALGIPFYFVYLLIVLPFKIAYKIIKNKMQINRKSKSIKKINISSIDTTALDEKTASFSTNKMESEDEITRQMEQMSKSILYTLETDQAVLVSEMAIIVKEYSDGLNAVLANSDTEGINLYNTNAELKGRIISKLGILQAKINESVAKRKKVESFNGDLNKVNQTLRGVQTYTSGYTDDISGGVATAKQR